MTHPAIAKTIAALESALATFDREEQDAAWQACDEALADLKQWAETPKITIDQLATLCKSSLPESEMRERAAQVAFNMGRHDIAKRIDTLPLAGESVGTVAVPSAELPAPPGPDAVARAIVFEYENTDRLTDAIAAAITQAEKRGEKREREAIIKICDEIADDHISPTAEIIAGLIRARSNLDE